MGTLVTGAGARVARNVRLKRLMAASLGTVFAFDAGIALAQSAPQQGVIEDIIVTATKQSTRLSQVPLSVAAVTRNELDEQGVTSPQDLARITPSLQITSGNQANGANVTIRGLSSSVGAPTVGIYLDDIALQRRGVNGAVAGNGTNFPQLFDVDRVEVLRGPQGTLYGGTSIGGTIRFILPQPKLEGFAVRAKSEVGFTEDGSSSYELGASGSYAVVPGKVGVAASAWGKHTGGYIDHVSRFTGKVLKDGENTNEENAYSGRVAALFAITDLLRVTPSLYTSYDKFNDADTFWTNVAGFTSATITTPQPNQNATGSFVLPSRVYPAYNVFGPYKTGFNCNVGENFQNVIPECVQRSPRTSTLVLPSLTVDYSVNDQLSFKSITSYTSDSNFGSSNFSYGDLNLYSAYTGKPFIATLPFYESNFVYRNRRTGFTQELRGNYTPQNWSWLSLVGGLYYSDFRTKTYARGDAPQLGDLLGALFGRTVLQQYGVNTGSTYFFRDESEREQDIAAFGEATVKVTEKLHLIGGLRVTRTKFAYREQDYGTTLSQAAPSFTSNYTAGSVTETPVSPKAVVQYFLDDKNMVFASATKGYRAGGVSAVPIGVPCADELRRLGFDPTVPGIPYKSDTVWSYEAGAKLRPAGNLLSVDASAYHVDWSNAQVNFRLACNGSYVANAAKETSDGVDLSVTLMPTDWLTLTAGVAYVDAKFEGLKITSSTGVTTTFINEGDRAPVPKWTYTLGAQVRYPVLGDKNGYFRVDYQHTGRYPRSFGPGTNGFGPDVYIAEPTDFVSLRTGVELGAWDVSLFVNNLFNSQDVLFVASNGGRNNCTFVSGTLTGCTRDTPYLQQTTFRPRTIGLTARYRFN